MRGHILKGSSATCATVKGDGNSINGLKYSGCDEAGPVSSTHHSFKHGTEVLGCVVCILAALAKNNHIRLII